MSEKDAYRGVSERRGRVENSLYEILSELDANTMESEERIRVEQSCIKIYTAFGGHELDRIYRDLDTDSDREESDQ